MGDYVEADEIVAVIETDKVNVEIRSSDAGVIKNFFAGEGDTVEVDADFFEVDPDAEKPAGSQPAAESKPVEVREDLLLINNQESKP